MKKTLALLALVLVATSSVAAVKDISKTVHNLGSTNTNGGHFTGTIDQVCVYCHTPHNASQSALLWNRGALPGQTFKLYSSANFSKNMYGGASLPANSPSLLCLSCHDGKSAINFLHSSSLGVDKYDQVGFGAGVATAINAPYDGGFFGNLSPANLGGTEADAALGNDLTNDHPIGFSYSAAATALGAATLNADPTTKTDISGRTVRLFGATQRMECSTCHDPHVNYNATGDTTLRPFLVMSNSGSALCLACHNK